MKNIFEIIRKSIIAILAFFSFFITITNYLNLHVFNVFNNNLYPRTYSMMMAMTWLYIVILARKKITEYLKKFNKKKISKENILILLFIIVIIISIISMIKVWNYDYFYRHLILFGVLNLAIVKLEFSKKETGRKKNWKDTKKSNKV